MSPFYPGHVCLSDCLSQNVFTLVNATPPTILELFETLKVFLSRSEDVHDIWLSSSDYFCHFFSHFLAQLLPKHIVNATLLTILAGSC